MGLTLDACFNFATKIASGLLVRVDLGLADKTHAGYKATVAGQKMGVEYKSGGFKQNTTGSVTIGFRVGGRLGE